MTRDEKLALAFGYFSSDAPWKNFKRSTQESGAGCRLHRGIARLGIPSLLETAISVFANGLFDNPVEAGNIGFEAT